MISIRTTSWKKENSQLEEDKLLGRGILEGLNVESPPQYGDAYEPIPRYMIIQLTSLVMLNHECVVFDDCQL